jgi:bacterioferritin B
VRAPVRCASPAPASRRSTTGQRRHRGLLLQQRFLTLTSGFGIGGVWEGTGMPAPAFAAALNEQVGHEFAAHQQYVAIAVHYDAETLPRLAAFFYAQALEERNHAMMMVQYLLDSGAEVAVPGTDAPRSSFADIVEPVQTALDQERRVTDQISALTALARENGDFQSEQFLGWFLKEQVEEVASMGDLLRVVQRAKDDPLRAEEHLAREGRSQEGGDPTAPAAAGGAV